MVLISWFRLLVEAFGEARRLERRMTAEARTVAE